MTKRTASLATLGSLLALATLLIAGSASAVTITPPPNFNSDDGTELFTTTGNVIGIEVFDLAQGASSFGFYFADDPGTRITLFETTDGAGDVASIDFLAGSVTDVDAMVLQSSFSSKTGDIGFYIDFGAPGSTTTLYTEALLNPGGLDLAGTFRSQTDPSQYLIGFELPNGQLLSLNVLNGVSPGGGGVVPEPSAALVFGIGALIVAARRPGRRS